MKKSPAAAGHELRSIGQLALAEAGDDAHRIEALTLKQDLLSQICEPIAGLGGQPAAEAEALQGIGAVALEGGAAEGGCHGELEKDPKAGRGGVKGGFAACVSP